MSTRTREISNSDDIIDSRQVIERIDSLETDLMGVHEEQRSSWLADEDRHPDEEPAEDFEAWLKVRAEDEGGEYEEFLQLREFLSNIEAVSGEALEYGATLIRDTYFEDYARELAEDIGAIQSDASWPNNHIDWEAAADALKQDYSSVDFGDVEYWVRS